MWYEKLQDLPISDQFGSNGKKPVDRTEKIKLIVSKGFPHQAIFAGEPITVLGVVGETGRKNEPLGSTLEEAIKKGGQFAAIKNKTKYQFICFAFDIKY